MFTNGQNMRLPLEAQDEKIVLEMEEQCMSGKEKVPGVAVSKKVNLTVLWEMEGPITIDFLEKGATINSASY